MESQKVDLFLATNGKFFAGHQIGAIRDLLISMDDSQWGFIQTIEFKDPTVALIISLLGGTLGIDRFFIGDTGKGIGKLLTCGGIGIWAIVDYFLIMSDTKENNTQKLMEVLGNESFSEQQHLT